MARYILLMAWKPTWMLVISSYGKPEGAPACLGLLHNKNLHTDFTWVGQTFTKPILHVSYCLELFVLENHRWLSIIFFFSGSPIGFYQVYWNKNESDNVLWDGRWEKKRWSSTQHEPSVGGVPLFWHQLILPATNPSAVPTQRQQFPPRSLQALFLAQVWWQI